MQFDFLKSIKTVDIKSINRPTQQWELGKQDWNHRENNDDRSYIKGQCLPIDPFQPSD